MNPGYRLVTLLIVVTVDKLLPGDGDGEGEGEGEGDGEGGGDGDVPLMTKVSEFEAKVCFGFAAVPSGLRTVTVTLPGAAKREAGITTVICVLLTLAGVRLAPPKATTALDVRVGPAKKLLPVRVSVRSELPALTVLGLNELSTGAWISKAPTSTVLL